MTTNTLTKGPRLKDLYQKIYNISTSLLNDFTDEGKREYPASAIFDEDTRIIMAKVVKIDEVITKKTQDRMNQIRIEMKELYSKSRATIAYAAYKKM
jgi:hypothetical protein